MWSYQGNEKEVGQTLREIWQRRGWKRTLNKQSSMEEEDKQLYRRPKMTRQDRDEEEDIAIVVCHAFVT